VKLYLFILFSFFLTLGTVTATSCTQLGNATLGASETPLKPKELDEILLEQDYQKISLRAVPNGTTATTATLLLDGAVDNRSTHPFILDTGSALSTIDPKIARAQAFKLHQTKKTLLGGADKQRQLTYAVVVPNLQLADFNAADNIFHTQDISFIKLDKKPIIGFIGMDFLRHHQAILDIPSKHLYLKQPKDKAAVVNGFELNHLLSKAGYQRIPLETSPSGHVTMMVRVNAEKPTRFIFDSGIPQTVIAADYAKKLQLKIKPDGTEGNGSGGGKIKFFETSVENISTGTLTWRPKTVMMIDLKNAQIGVPIAGGIGLDWMQAHQAVIDFSNNVVFVKSLSQQEIDHAN
jgi:predicted aspartyl protease